MHRPLHLSALRSRLTCAVSDLRSGTDEDGVSRFLNGDDPPKLDCLIADLEATPYFEEKVLSKFKGKYWKAMCDYAHTGGLHVQQ